MAGEISTNSLFGAGRKMDAFSFFAASVVVIMRRNDQMPADFSGNGGRAFAEFRSDLFKTPSLFNTSFDGDPVREGKMSAFSRFIKSIHIKYSFH